MFKAVPESLILTYIIEISINLAKKVRITLNQSFYIRLKNVILK